MLDRGAVDRLRAVDTAGNPVVSVYLGLRPDPGQLRSITTQIKALVHPLREQTETADGAGDWTRQVRAGLDSAIAMAEGVATDLGRGAALFVCPAAGLAEHISLPAPVPDRAAVGATPYLGPLEALLGRSHRFSAVVVNRRSASVFRFSNGALDAHEELSEEEVRKDNYGGFSGYDEHHARAHAETVAQRLFRAVVARLSSLQRAGELELLALGGNQVNVDALLAEMPPELKGHLAGTFTVDPHRATPAEILEHCRDLAGRRDALDDERQVAELMDAAGGRGRGVVGLDRTLDAVNQRAVDRLLVAAAQVTPGVVCPACGWLARSGATCLSCGAPTRPVSDLFDAAAEATRGRGGSVRYLLSPGLLAGPEIGAVVRFPVPAGVGGEPGTSEV